MRPDASAATGDFAADTERYRRELIAHCYRMLGSPDEAEDIVQETYLRAWRAYDRFEGRSSVRTWLYQIATNACLTALEHRDRRPLPSGLGPPAADPDAPPVPVDHWLQPIPDALVTPDSADPAAVVAARESVRLALVASLQLLPGRQRAVLILRETLAFPAAEVAEMLGTTVAAVKSMLQRARRTLNRASPDNVGELTEPQQRELLDGYIAGFQNADLATLERVLRRDAVLELAGTRTWFAGRQTCLAMLRQVIGEPGDWRMIPVAANGQPAVTAYHHGSPFGLAILTMASGGITRVTAFQSADLVARFT